MKKRAAISLNLVDVVNMASRIHNPSANLAVLFLVLVPVVFGAINLPIEVVGPDGTTASVTVHLPAGRAAGPVAQDAGTWFELHGYGQRAA